MPHKKRISRHPKTDVGDFDKCAIQQIVNKFSNKHGLLPILKSLLKEMLNFISNKRVLKKIGFSL